MNHDSDLIRRALAAYYRSGDGSVTPPSAAYVREHKGLHYVVVKATAGLPVVYRVRTVNGNDVLKRMKRFPVDVL